VNVRRVEYQSGDFIGNRKSRRHPRRKFRIANSNARETDAAEVIVTFDPSA